MIIQVVLATMEKVSAMAMAMAMVKEKVVAMVVAMVEVVHHHIKGTKLFNSYALINDYT
jgi:hypothetical protein